MKISSFLRSRFRKCPKSVPQKFQVQKNRSIERFFGASEGTRTLDLLITNQLRYQLCHAGVSTTAIVSHLASACQSFRAKILVESAFNVAVIQLALFIRLFSIGRFKLLVCADEVAFEMRKLS